MRKGKINYQMWIQFGVGALVGIIMYLLMYGVAALDVTEINWMKQASFDIQQHYTGWVFFRNGDWQFPLGLTDRMTYPSSLSVFYTDSIPLLAIPLKLFRFFLPEQFQYFGLFGLLCFVMQGGMGSLITGKFMKSKAGAMFGALLFVMCPILLFRMYYHTALAAHFLILISLYTWLSDTLSWKRGLIIWAVLGALCVSIEVYFLPMCGLILLGYCVQRLIAKRQTWWQCGLQIVTYCAGALLTMWLVGGFYGEVSSGSFGFGIFNANMVTFINNLGVGKILPPIAQLGNQYEGFGYLGLGLIVLIIIGCVTGVGKRIRKEIVLGKNKGNGKATEEKVQEEENEGVDTVEIPWYRNSWVLSAAGMLVVAFLLAVGINGYLGAIEVWTISLPQWLYNICQIFRSSGRMIWVAVYVLYVVAVAMLTKYYNKLLVQVMILGVCAVIQIWDGDSWFETKRYTNDMVEEHAELQEILEQYDAVVYLGNAGDGLKNEIGQIASRLDMTVSDFYLSRSSTDVVNYRQSVIQGLLNGEIDEHTVYVLNGAWYQSEYDMYVYNFEGYIIGVAEPLEGKQPLEVCENEWFYFESDGTENTSNENVVVLNAQEENIGNILELPKGVYIVEIMGENVEELQGYLLFEEEGGTFKAKLSNGMQDGNMIFCFEIEETMKDIRLKICNCGEQDIEIQCSYLYEIEVE